MRLGRVMKGKQELRQEEGHPRKGNSGAKAQRRESSGT